MKIPIAKVDNGIWIFLDEKRQTELRKIFRALRAFRSLLGAIENCDWNVGSLNDLMTLSSEIFPACSSITADKETECK